MIQWQLERDVLTDQNCEDIISLAALKRHLWVVGIDADEDYIKELRASAISTIEEQFNTSLINRTHTLVIDRFPYYWVSVQQLIPMQVGIVIPVWPLNTITAMTYTDFLNVSQTVDVTKLQLRKYKPPSIFAEQGKVWPFVNPQQVANVTITFTAGFATLKPVPGELKHAIRLMVGHWYKNREPAQQALLQAMPMGIDELLRTHKWWW